jgi:hypothetical protein
MFGDAYFVTSDETWDPSLFPDGQVNSSVNIIVNSGVTLEINDLTVLMPYRHSIRILPGARIVANGSTFTNACGPTWRGFEMLWDPCSNESSVRAQLEMNFGCEINHAETGIRNSITKYAAAYGDKYFGGRCRIKSTTFRDNVCDVALTNDYFHNSSTAFDVNYEFEQCEFILKQIPSPHEIVNFNIDSKGYINGAVNNAPSPNYCGIAQYGPRFIMARTNAVLISNCKFTNNNIYDAVLNPNAYGTTPTSEMTAIAGIRSGFRVYGSTAPLDEATTFDSHIRGFRNGINIRDVYDFKYCEDSPVLTSRNIDINSTAFECFKGVVAGAFAYLDMRNNLFRALPSDYYMPATAFGNNSFRAGSDISNGALTNAYFRYVNSIHVDNGNPLGLKYGIKVDNLGGGENYIFRNEFRNIQGLNNQFNLVSCGIACYNINRGLDEVQQNPDGSVTTILGAQGLRLECNTFNNCTNDIIVTGAQPTTANGVALDQHKTWHSFQSLTSAGNNFTLSITGPGNANPTTWIFPKDNDDMSTYNLKNLNPPLPPVGVPRRYRYYPMDFNGTNYTSFPIEMSVFDNTLLPGDLNQCMDESENGNIPTNNVVAQIQQINQQLSDKQHEYHDLVDNGETALLNQKIEQATYSNIITLYNELMAVSPNMSELNIVEAIAQELVLPNSLLTAILASNPTAAQSTKVAEALALKQEPLSAAQIQSIYNGQNVLTIKQIMELQMEELQTKRSHFLGILEERAHEGELTRAEFFALLEPDNYLNDRLTMAHWLRNADQFEESQAMLIGVKDRFELDKFQNAIVDAAWSFYNLKQAIESDQDSSLTESQIEALKEMVRSDNPGSVELARTLLSVYGFEVYFNDANRSMVETTLSDHATAIAQESILLYPNPADKTISINYKPFAGVAGTVRIINAEGLILHQQSLGEMHTDLVLDIDHLPTGVYSIHLLGKENQVLTTTNFVKL